MAKVPDAQVLSDLDAAVDYAKLSEGRGGGWLEAVIEWFGRYL